eukprot:CAMPEP_0179056940 /NCGR_PEP_ID=MMETSP0796-20121207/24072_1 /TAXON_ID=73915 /ORGANISM="Pyrodinium bahamense, Strain pbaha01" /LENGTH=133 /DNA_ID=CAMNT_0020753633 /DNA_START=1065 /DNA_END=1467 /DNA_ORIENTATION=+
MVLCAQALVVFAAAYCLHRSAFGTTTVPDGQPLAPQEASKKVTEAAFSSTELLTSSTTILRWEMPSQPTTAVVANMLTERVAAQGWRRPRNRRVGNDHLNRLGDGGCSPSLSQMSSLGASDTTAYPNMPHDPG